MPTDAITLALAASIYPPALAVVIALGRGPEVRLRVVLFVLSAYCTVLATGALMLFLFDEVQVPHVAILRPTAALYVAAGGVLLVIAARLRRPRTRSRARDQATRTGRYLRSRRLVVALGFLLYVVPSPIFVGAVKALSDASVSSAEKIIYLVLTLLIMLWLIELPMLALLLFPARSVTALEAVNSWFVIHGRRMLVLTSGLLGVYLIAVGAVELASGP